MPTLSNWCRQPIKLTQTMLMIAAQVMHRTRLRLRSRAALAAETLFLKKQLALYQESNSRWRCDLNTTRFTLVWLSYWFDWEPALTIVKPETFKRWRRQGWRLLWKRPSPPGRPSIPPELQALIRRMARENVTWGQQRIANELLLKLGLRVSPRTVRKYMPSDCVGGPGKSCSSQCWSTFIRNQAKGLILTGVTAEMTRRARVVLAHLRQLSRNCFNKEPQREVMQVRPAGNLVVIRLDQSDRSSVVELLNRIEGIRRVERSPPEQSKLRHPIFSAAAQGHRVARVEVRSVIPVRCSPAPSYPKELDIESVNNGVMRSSSWPWAA
jgi:hypothetical protein